MSFINTELAKTLNRVQRPGDYYTAGALEIFAPRLEVDGVGPIALPLLPVQARQLIAVANKHPTGGDRKLWSTPRFGEPGKSTLHRYKSAGAGKKPSRTS